MTASFRDSWRIRPTWPQTTVLALFTLDMLFLPMFHFRGLPFKPFYLVVAAYVFAAMTSRPVRAMVGWCWSLAIVCWIGAFYLFLVEDGARLSETARNSLVWFLAPLAFAFGWKHRRAKLNFLLLFVFFYFALNLVLTFEYQNLPWLVSFYGLENYPMDVRSPGIHWNPNLSAFAANLMLLAIVLGEHHGVIKVSTVARWAVFLSTIGTHMLLGSRGEFASALLLGTMWTYDAMTAHGRRRLLRFVLVGGTVAIIFLAAAYVSLEYLAARSEIFAFAQRKYTEKTTLASEGELSDKGARGNSVLLRPFLQAEKGYDRFLVSPVWGTGFDTGRWHPFDNTYFHNDWIAVLIAGGVLGLLLFVGVLLQLRPLGLIALLPFFITAPFNSFILAPQHMMFYFASAGLLAGSIDWREQLAACNREATALYRERRSPSGKPEHQGVLSAGHQENVRRVFRRRYPNRIECR